MESVLATVFILALVFMFFAGIGVAKFLGTAAVVVIIVVLLISVATGQGSSFGPNATHSNTFPYNRRRGKRR